MAFIGDTLSTQGKILPEIFVVDLPEHNRDYACAGDKPLEGTETTLPAPPKNVVQRRLTFTENRHWPGVARIPRHWLRVSPDGSSIAFLMKDNNGVVQLWLISPNGGKPQQLTQGKQSIQSAFSWDPRGNRLTFIRENSVMLCEIISGNTYCLTQPTASPPLAEAVVFSPNGHHIAFMRKIAGYTQIFTVSTDC